jgi:hypothetical protein
MNTAQLKAISWGSALLFGGGLAAYVGNYLVKREEFERRVAAAEIQIKLAQVAAVEKKAEDIVAYEQVHETLYKYNWTAKPPPPPPEPDAPKGPEVPVAQPVSNLLKVLLVRADTTVEAESRAVIKYTPAARVTLKDQTLVKHVGDKLDAPNENISIAAILPEGVRFKFSDSSRSEELVNVVEFQGRIDMSALATRSSLPVNNTISFPRTSTFNQQPPRTVQLGPDQYYLGTEDMLEWEQDYTVYLTEIEHDRHRDPTTGKYDGILLKSVPPGSKAAAYGAKDGDVIKSINGHPVNSSQEAIAFVKNNKDKYDVWEVEVENKGKTKIVTYKSPKKK